MKIMNNSLKLLAYFMICSIFLVSCDLDEDLTSDQDSNNSEITKSNELLNQSPFTEQIGFTDEDRSEADYDVDELSFILGSTLISASAGMSHFAVVIIDNGGANHLITWGDNFYGQLGNGSAYETYSYDLVEVPCPAAGEYWTVVKCGAYQTYAITDQGKLYGWGLNYPVGFTNYWSFLGLGSFLGGNPNEMYNTPQLVNVGPVVQEESAISIDETHTLALVDNGSTYDLYGWGVNLEYELTADHSGPQEYPVQIDFSTQIGLPGVYPVQVAAGQYHSLALASNGILYSWGNQYSGQLGRGTPVSTPEYPGEVINYFVTSGDWKTIEARGYVSLATMYDGTIGGTLWLWGWNNWNMLGVGTGQPAVIDIPTQEGTFDSNWQDQGGNVRQSIGWAPDDPYFLATTTTGRVYSWGVDWDNRLGRSAISSFPTVVPAPAPTDATLSSGFTLPFGFSFVAAGGYASLVICTTYNTPLAYAFGSNY